MGSKGSKQTAIVRCPPGCRPAYPIQRLFQVPCQQITYFQMPMQQQMPMQVPQYQQQFQPQYQQQYQQQYQPMQIPMQMPQYQPMLQQQMQMPIQQQPVAPVAQNCDGFNLPAVEYTPNIQPRPQQPQYQISCPPGCVSDKQSVRPSSAASSASSSSSDSSSSSSSRSSSSRSSRNRNSRTETELSTAQLNTGRNSGASVNSNSIEKIFQLIDVDGSGTISVEEAGKILLKLNTKLGRAYNEDDLNAFFSALDKNSDGRLTLEEFKGAFNALTNQ